MSNTDERAIMIALMKVAGIEVPANPGSDASAEALNCLATFVHVQNQMLGAVQVYLASLINQAVAEDGECGCDPSHLEEGPDGGCALQEARKIVERIEGMRDGYARLLWLPPEALA